MSGICTLEIESRIAILTIDAPPVNALGAAVRQAIHDGLGAAIADENADAVILTCAGRTFFAGADIGEFGKPFADPQLSDIIGRMENSPKPVIAAIHGTALGGGLEVALGCHYRIAVPSAKVGLPEVLLGLLPGGGGTQRIPRLIGVEPALEMLTGGRPLGAKVALEKGIVDAIVAEGRLREDAIAYVRGLVERNASLRRVRDLDEKVAAARGHPEIFAEFRKRNAALFRGFKAPEHIIKAIEASVELPFDKGIEREWELFRELESSPESAAQRHIFFAERETAKVPDVPSSTEVLPVKSVGVIGAGTMGGGIAMNFLNAGIPVTLVEVRQDALDRGVAVIRRNYENSAKKGRLRAEDVEKRMALLHPVLDFAALGAADLVIEAVFESMPLKKEVFAKLDAVAKPEAILASNTSFLDLNEIAAATGRPQQVIGLHFFSPANVMRLLEVVRGAKTSKPTVATAMKLAKQIGKVPVLSGVCNGFIANRIMAARGVQADGLILEGVSPTDTDRVMRDFGFAMGHFQMLDLVGLDVLGRDSAELTVMTELVAAGRLGQKSGAGYYDYDEKRSSSVAPAALDIIGSFAREQGIAPKPATDEQILSRLLYPVVNEGAKVLEEGIALRPSDIDVALITGYGWPVYTGGPMFWADRIGLPKVLAGLKALQTEYGDGFAPSALLERLAAEGRGFGDL
jgi:3-hydroxyacyl-CoA dehydrogenase